jgi:transposase-like protein
MFLMAVRWYLRYSLSYRDTVELLEERGVHVAHATIIRQIKYLNNLVEQDHRSIKRITKPMLGFKSFVTAEKTLAGIEAMHMLQKKQVEMQRMPACSNVSFIDDLFGTSV